MGFTLCFKKFCLMREYLRHDALWFLILDIKAGRNAETFYQLNCKRLITAGFLSNVDEMKVTLNVSLIQFAAANTTSRFTVYTGRQFASLSRGTDLYSQQLESSRPLKRRFVPSCMSDRRKEDRWG